MESVPRFFPGSVTQKLSFTVEFYGDSTHGYEVVVQKPGGSEFHWDADQDLDNLLLVLAQELEAKLNSNDPQDL
jgi:hypothetical protein